MLNNEYDNKHFIGKNTQLLKFLYTNNLEYCCNLDFENMFEIQRFDYLASIRKLSSYFNNFKDNYYSKLFIKYQNDNFNKPIYVQNYDYDLDEILLQYTKCFKNMRLLLVWPIAGIKNLLETEFYKTLDKNGFVHAIKELDLTYKQIQGIIYQIYYDKSGFKKFQSIKGKQEKSQGNNNINKIFVILLEPNDPKNISGKDAKLKNYLREILRKEKNINTKINFFLHITDNFSQTIELTQLFFNKNSLRLLEYQRLDLLLNKNISKSVTIFMTFKNWLYQKINLVDQIRFLLYGDIIWFLLGIKNIDKLDLLLLTETNNDSFLKNEIDYFFKNQETKFNFINSVNDLNPDSSKMLEEELIFNPKNHLYFFGIKIISMINEFNIRINKNKSSGYADLLYLMKFSKNKIKLPKFDIKKEEIENLVKKIKMDLYNLYQLDYDTIYIKKLLML